MSSITPFTDTMLRLGGGTPADHPKPRPEEADQPLSGLDLRFNSQKIGAQLFLATNILLCFDVHDNGRHRELIAASVYSSEAICQ